MIINKAVNLMVKEAEKVNLTPVEIKAKKQIRENTLKKIEYGHGMENIADDMLPELVPKLIYLGSIAPIEVLKNLGEKMMKISSELELKIEQGYKNEAERLFDSKRIRTEVKRMLRNDEKSQNFLKETLLLMEDKGLSNFIEKITTIAKEKIGANGSFEEFVYNQGATGKEWKYAMSQKFLSSFENSPIEQLKNTISYFIKKPNNEIKP